MLLRVFKTSMDLSANLRRARGTLKPVTTRRTLESGRIISERRTDRGDFGVVDEQQAIEENAKEAPSNFNRKLESIQDALSGKCTVGVRLDLQVAQVSSGVYLSSQDVAETLSLLQAHEITHIVNVASMVDNLFPKQFTYLALRVVDLPTYDLRRHFDLVLSFIREAVDAGGKVLVHCNKGVSRSATLVTAYIMRYEKKDLEQALKQVKAVRNVVCPNFGFMKQLKEFEEELNQLKN